MFCQAAPAQSPICWPSPPVQAAHVDGDVVVDLALGNVGEIGRGPGAVPLHHLAVGREVARGEHNGLGADELLVRAIGRLGDNGLDAPLGAVGRTSAHELLGNHVVDDGAAGLFDLGGQGRHDEGLAPAGAGCVRLAPAVGAERLVERAGGGESRVLLQRGQVAGTFHDVDEPVHGFLAVGIPGGPFLLVGPIGPVCKLGGDILVRGTVDARGLHGLTVHGVVRAAAGNGLRAGRDEHGLQSRLGSRQRRGQAGGASADHDHLRLGGVGNGIVGNGFGGSEERRRRGGGCRFGSARGGALSCAAQPARPEAMPAPPTSPAAFRKLRRDS